MVSGTVVTVGVAKCRSAAHAKISQEKACMRARSANNVANTGAGTPRGRFVISGQRILWGKHPSDVEY